MYNPTVNVKFTFGDTEIIVHDLNISDIESYTIEDENDEDEYPDKWEIVAYNDFADIDMSVEVVKNKLDLDELEDLRQGLVEYGDRYKIYYLHDTRNASLDDFKNTFRGYYDYEQDYTKEFWKTIGWLDSVLVVLPDNNENYIDWEYATKELFDGNVFSLEYEHGVLVFNR
jgi:antirestriction protein